MSSPFLEPEMLVKQLLPVLVLAAIAAATGVVTFIAFKVELLLW
jgi:hypothetical protein